MKWMRERDLLIAQTMAFVQSVTGKKPDGDKPCAVRRQPSPIRFLPCHARHRGDARRRRSPIPSRRSRSHIARTPQRSEYQNEIQARVANFRAHQQRFLREREDYCTSTMAKVQKALKDLPPPRLDK